MIERDQGALTTEPETPVSAAQEARGWLDRAASWLLDTNGYRDGNLTLAFAEAAAAIGTGYAVLAQVEAPGISLVPSSDAAAVAFFRRQAQAVEEARPHDGEVPRGEAAHWLEGDDEIFTAGDERAETSR